jgi:signal transduction histidine kinase
MDGMRWGQVTRSRLGLKSETLDFWYRRFRLWSGRLSLFQQFALMASIVLSFTMITVGSWVSSRIADGVLHSGAGAAALYMTNFLEPNVQSLAALGGLTSEEIARLDKLSEDLALRRHVASIKIWRPDGTIVYSSRKSLMGQRFQTSAIQPALRGKISSAMADLDEDDSEFERRLSIPLYEVFAPLYKSGTGEVIAVGEFYENATDLLGETTVATRDAWLMVALSAFVMLGTLFAIVHRGSTTIERQRALLRERLREQTWLRHRHSTLEAKMRTALSETARIDEQVQRRLGVELHDGPVQLVSFVLLRIDEMRSALTGAHGSSETIEAVRASASQALKDIRSIASGLILPGFHDATEPLGIVRTVIDAHENRTGSHVALYASEIPKSLAPDLIRCIGRVTQEALTNAFKHAGAVEQTVTMSMQDGMLRLSIRDGGPGFEPSKSASKRRNQGLGLVGMEHRVESVGGRFEIASSPGLGTEVVAFIPLGRSTSVKEAGSQLESR